MSHQPPLPTRVEAIEMALIIAILAHKTARTPTQRRKAYARIEELKREKQAAERAND